MSSEMIGFRTDLFIDTAKELLRADETERALWLLDNLPAFYRDHIPKEVHELKNEILKRIATPRAYQDAPYETGVINLEHGNKMDASLRGKLIFKDMEWFNSQGLTPHIIDYGPGEFWLPIIAHNKGLKFTYEPVGLNPEALSAVMTHISEHLVFKKPDGVPTMFIACEIIEHLWNEEDIKTEMLFHCDLADLIHISTPKYTFDYGCTDWKTKEVLGHLRAYTPHEFSQVVMRMFPEYTSLYFDSFIQHMRLTLNRTKIPGLLERKGEGL